MRLILLPFFLLISSVVLAAPPVQPDSILRSCPTDTMCFNTFCTYSVKTPIGSHIYHWKVTNNAKIVSASPVDSAWVTIGYNTVNLKPGSAQISVRSEYLSVYSSQTVTSVIVGPNPNTDITFYPGCANQSNVISFTGSPAGIYRIYRLDGTDRTETESVGGSIINIKPLVYGVDTVLVIKGYIGDAAHQSCPTTLIEKATYTIDPLPDTNIAFTILNPTVCLNSEDVIIKINSSQKFRSYTVFNGSITALLPDFTSLNDGDTIKLTIPKSKLDTTGNYKLYVKVHNVGCDYYSLANSPKILEVKRLPNLNLSVESDKDSICPGDTVTLILRNLQAGFKYIVKDSIAGVNTKISDTITGTGADYTYKVPSSSLSANYNILNIWVQNNLGCYKSRLKDTAIVKLQKVPQGNLPLALSYFKTCFEDTTLLPLHVTHNTELGVVYTAKLGNTIVGGPFIGTGLSYQYDILLKKLNTGLNKIPIYAQIYNCKSVTLNDTLKIFRSKKINTNLNSSGSTICPNMDGKITVNNSEDSISYFAQSVGGITYQSDTLKGNGGNITLTVPKTAFVPGTNNIFKIIAFSTYNSNCTKELIKRDTIVVYKIPNQLLSIQPSINCIGDSGSLTISGSESIVKYKAYRDTNAAPCNIGMGNNGDLKLKIPPSCLAVGLNKFIVMAYTGYGQCAPVKMNEESSITIVPYPADDLQIAFNGGELCEEQTLAAISVLNSQTDVLYMAYDILDKPILQIPIPGDAGKPATLYIHRDSLHYTSNTITIRATMSNLCPINLKAHPVITKLAVPLTNMKVSSKNYICPQDHGTIVLDTTEKDVEYTIQINGVLKPVKYNNPGGGKLTITLDTLPKGFYLIEVFAKRGMNCVPHKLADTTSLTVKVPSADKSLANSSSCPGIPGNLKILSTESGVQYQAYKNSVPVGNPMMGAENQPLTLIIPTSVLTDSVNVFQVKAFIGACSPVLLNSTATIRVIAFPDTSKNILPDTKCPESSIADLIMFSPEPNITYSAYTYYGNKKGKFLDTVLVGVPTPSVSLILPMDSLKIGINPIIIYANNGCGDYAIKYKPYVDVTDTPRLSFGYQVENACYGKNARVIIQSSQSGVYYFAKSAGNIISDKVRGTDGNISLTVSSDKLLPDAKNNIVLYANNGCIDWKLQKTADIYVSTASKAGIINKDFGSKIGYTCIDSINATLTLSGMKGSINDWIVSTDSMKTWKSTLQAETTIHMNYLNVYSCYKAIVTNGNCPADTTKPTCDFIRYYPKTNLQLLNDTICEGQPGILTLKNFEASVDYVLHEYPNFTIIPTSADTTGKDLLLAVPGLKKSTQYWLQASKGYAYHDTVKYCSKMFRSYSSIKVINVIHPLFLDSSHLKLKCENNTSTYSVQKQKGTYYHWSADGGQINGDSTANPAEASWYFDPVNAGNNILYLHSIDSATKCRFTQSYKIQIDDSIKPVILCPNQSPSYSIERTKAINGLIFIPITDSSFNPLDVSDNCGIKKLLNSYNDSSSLINGWLSFPVDQYRYEYSKDIKWVAYDLAGNSDSCSFTVNLKVIDPVEPVSAFTPDGNGKNDTWYINRIERYSSETMIKVFDRNGRIVWECNGNCTEAWDGNDQSGNRVPVDSYHYQVFMKGKVISMGIVTVIY